MSDGGANPERRHADRGTDGSAPECAAAVHAARSPDGVALRVPDTELTWSALDRLIADRIRARRGAPKVLALRARRTVDFAVEILAAARRGRAIALVSPRLPAGPAADFIRLTGARWLPPGHDDAELHSAAEDCGRIPAPDEPLTFMQTSGSTGEPRIIAHSWRNHTESARLAAQALDLCDRDRWFWSLPPHHVGGLSILFRCLQAGASIALPARDARAESLRSALIRTGSTMVSCVPTQLDRLVRDGACPGSLRAVIVGGAPVDTRLIHDAIEAGYPVRTTYGCTESSSMVTLSRPYERAPETIHAGSPIETGAVSIDARRSIRVRGKFVAVGTLTDGVIRPITDDEGWYDTGDVGSFDERGRLVVAGRSDNVFISGGENISPRELENALSAVKGIIRAVVVPFSDQEYGQRPAAFLECDGPIPTVDIVRRHLEGRLPRYMHPDIVLPLGPPPAGHLKWPRDRLIERANEAGKG